MIGERPLGVQGGKSEIAGTFNHNAVNARETGL